MLQKYHPNPLSQFLALHNTQTAYSHVHAHSLTASVANGHNPFQQHHNTATLLAVANHNSSQLQHQHQQQQQHHNNPHNYQHHPTQHHNNLVDHLNAQQHHSARKRLDTTTPTALNHHHHHHHQQQQQHHQQIIEAATTSLDVGKSFTIAAILGLQKNAMEHTHRDYNNVINLSLNGGNNSSSNTNSSHNSPDNRPPFTVNTKDDEQQHQINLHNIRSNTPLNNNVNNNTEDSISNLNGSKSNICHTLTATSSVNNFNCDGISNGGTGVLVNRYLPSAVTTSSISMAHQQQTRTNSFVAVAAAAAAVNVTHGTPSALQSLQQLHQHHAHQANLNFHREKLKSEINIKKSSLKNKRVRTIFTPEQLERLEAEFERQQYMVGPERLYLAHTLQLTEAQVKVWFQNRRIKWRKHHLELTQQRLALLRQTQLTNNNSSNSIVNGGNGGLEAHPNSINVHDCDEMDEIKQREDIRDLTESRHDTESDLSICNDSMDGESVVDGEGD